MRIRSEVVAAAIALACWAAVCQAQMSLVASAPSPAVLYTKEKAPATPALADLPLQASVSRDGITWTFEKPVRVGQFVGGDWYVVGPVTVTAIEPKALCGEEVTNVSDEEKGRKELSGKYLRNGSMLNRGNGGLDSRSRLYKPEAVARLPISMKPGDALVSCISLPKYIGNHTSIDTVSVLTCLKEPVPADAFRPGYMDRRQTLYRASDLKRELLPRLVPPAGVAGEKLKLPDLADLRKRFSRPWIDMVFGYMEDNTSYQFDGYGRQVDQTVANASLLLCLDLKPEEKEGLLRNLVQYGIDLYGDLKGGWPGWPALGGWGSGRKWPIVFAGLLLGDLEMAFINRTFPQAKFQEDIMTHYDDCWTGADVVYGGHTGWTIENPERRALAWGPYENVHPSRWTGWIGTSYRTNMTSSTWIGSALLIRMFRAEKEWGHDAFLDYEDRWMYEEDFGMRNPTRLSVPGCGYDPFAEAMWKAYRQKLPEIPGRDTAQRPIDGWKKTRELKGPEVAVGRGRELLVKGKPLFPILLFAEHPGRIDDAVAIGANIVAEGIFEKPESFHQFWMLNSHDEKWVQEQVAKDAKKKLAVGVNIAAATQNDGFLDALAAKGLYGVFGADARAIGHPALLGWIHIDEPDAVAAQGAKMTDAQLHTFSVEGEAGRKFSQETGLTIDKLKLFNQAYRCMRNVKSSANSDQWYGAKPALKDLPDYLLLVQPAYEWMKKMDKGRPAFLTVGQAFFGLLADGQKDQCEAYLKNCEAVGCRMPADKTADSVKKLRDLAPGKLVYAWVETKGPKPEEIRAAVRSAIAAGATGIGYRGFEGLTLEKIDPAVTAELKKIDEQITAHAAELIADPSKAETILK